MRIQDIELIPVGIELNESLRWGACISEWKGEIIVKVLTDEGITGIGAATFDPVVPVVINRILKPILLGEDPTFIRRLWEKMYWKARYKGSTTKAISSIDIALWDILGKVTGEPIYKLLGAHKNKVPVYSAPSLKPPEIVAEETKEASRLGFPAVKIRVGNIWMGFPQKEALEKDLEIVNAAIENKGNMEIAIDANFAYDYHTAVAQAREFEKLSPIRWLEEPIYSSGSVNAYVREHRRLRASINTPIAIGESLFTRYEFEDVLDTGAADIIQPDCVLVGGISEAKRIADMSTLHNITFMPHVCMNMANIGFIANLHVIGSAPNTLYAEYDPYDNPLREELLKKPVKAKNGWINIPDGPGLGIELDQNSIDKYRLSNMPFSFVCESRNRSCSKD